MMISDSGLLFWATLYSLLQQGSKTCCYIENCWGFWLYGFS